MIKNDQQYKEIKEQWNTLNEERSELVRVECSLRDMDYNFHRDSVQSQMDVLMQQMHDYEAAVRPPLRVTVKHIISDVNYVVELSRHPWHPLYTLNFKYLSGGTRFSLLLPKDKLQDIHDIIERTLELKDLGD